MKKNMKLQLTNPILLASKQRTKDDSSKIYDINGWEIPVFKMRQDDPFALVITLGITREDHSSKYLRDVQGPYSPKRNSNTSSEDKVLKDRNKLMIYFLAT